MLTAARFVKSRLAPLTGFTGRSTRYYTGSVGIRVVGVRARQTKESRLARPISLIDVSALGALPAGVPRIYQDQRDTSENRLVLQKRPELRERPTMQNITLLLPNRYPLANSTKIFYLDAAPGAFSLRNDLLGNYVVGVRGKTLFFAREFFQSALRCASVLFLKVTAQPSMSMADRLECLTAVPDAIGSRCDFIDSEIYAKEILYVRHQRIINITGCSQVKSSTMQDKISLSLLRFKQSGLTLPRGILHPQSTSRTQYANGRSTGKSQVFMIVGNCPVLAKCALRLFVQLVGVGHLADSPNNQLARKREGRTGFVVAQSVNGVLTKHLGFPSPIGNPITAFIDRFKRLLQQSHLLRSWLEFHFGGQLHNYTVA